MADATPPNSDSRPVAGGSFPGVAGVLAGRFHIEARLGAAVIGTQALRNMMAHGELIGVAILVIIGAALIALPPARQPAEKQRVC